MIVESIKSYMHLIGDKVRTSVYNTMIDPKTNKKYLEIQEHEFFLYSKTGQVERVRENYNKVDRRV